MSPGRGNLEDGRPARRRDEPGADGRGPWMVVSTNGLFSHTLLTGITRAEAERLLEDVRCDECGRAVSGVPPWETGVVVSQFVCRHCRAGGETREGTEFYLLQEGVDIDVL